MPNCIIGLGGKRRLIKNYLFTTGLVFFLIVSASSSTSFTGDKLPENDIYESKNEIDQNYGRESISHRLSVETPANWLPMGLVKSGGWHPDILQLSNGSYVMVYNCGYTVATSGRINLSLSNDLINWGLPVTVTSGSRPFMPSIVELPNGSFLVAYEIVPGDEQPPYPLYTSISSDLVTWSSPRLTLSFAGRHPEMIIDDGGVLRLVALDDEGDGQAGTETIYYTSYNDSDYTWDTPQKLLPAPHSRDWTPSFLQLQNGSYLVTFGSDFSGTWHLYFSISDDFQTWSDPVQIPLGSIGYYHVTDQLKNGDIITFFTYASGGINVSVTTDFQTWNGPTSVTPFGESQWVIERTSTRVIELEDGSLWFFPLTAADGIYCYAVPSPSVIDPQDDFSYTHGDVGYSIFWAITDLYPSNYTVYRNNTVFAQGNYTDSVITWVDCQDVGAHNFTCVVMNSFGLTASDEVWVTVLPSPPDITPPVISSPDNISFYNGSIGYTIRWNGSDDQPWWASVWRNQELIYDKAWRGDDIVISLDNLIAGTYEYNCTLFDKAGNSASNNVTVTVIEVLPEGIPPVIIPPDPPTGYVEGTTGHYLLWNCSDDYPHSYRLLIDGTEADYGPWHGGTINTSIDGLEAGSWIANLTVWDISGNNASSQVIITVIPPLPDTIPPEVSKPAETIIAENTAGTIMWEVTDENPGNYSIRKNNTLVYKQEFWTPGIIRYSFESLSLGTWEFTLTAWDQAGNNASSSAIVKVLPGSAIDTTPPQISHVPDQGITYGTKNNSVIVYLFDEHPGGYNVTISTYNETTDIKWITPNLKVRISFDGLVVGGHNVSITAWDSFSNIATRTFHVTVTGESYPPVISSPPDIVVPEGTYPEIRWNYTDDDPSHYEIISLPDGEVLVTVELFLVVGGGNEQIVYIPDHLHMTGNQTFRCIIYDESGNYAYDDVMVTFTRSQAAQGFECQYLVMVLLVLAAIRVKIIIKRRTGR